MIHYHCSSYYMSPAKQYYGKNNILISFASLMKKVVITSACRSAIGSYGRSLKNVESFDLGSSVIEASIKKSKLKKNETQRAPARVPHRDLNG